MPIPQLITSTEDFPIKPKDIDASEHLFGAFGNNETEVSAGWIVRFAQKRNAGWTPFTYEEINGFYSEKLNDGFTFNQLVETEMIPPNLTRAYAGHHDEQNLDCGGWLAKENSNDKYYFTNDFVTRCFKSRPVKQPA